MCALKHFFVNTNLEIGKLIFKYVLCGVNVNAV